MSEFKFHFVSYRSKAYDYASFSCGVELMDLWLQKSAGQNERLNRSRTFLLVDAGHESRVVYGYFALVNYQIAPEDASVVDGRPYRYPMPATLLTRLAVSSNVQGLGLGRLLLAQAMRHTLASLQYSGSEVFLVDAIDDNAVRFYERHGLQVLRDDGQRLFIPTRKIAASLDAGSPEA